MGVAVLLTKRASRDRAVSRSAGRADRPDEWADPVAGDGVPLDQGSGELAEGLHVSRRAALGAGKCGERGAVPGGSSFNFNY
jgi:hypothetical protein